MFNRRAFYVGLRLKLEKLLVSGGRYEEVERLVRRYLWVNRIFVGCDVQPRDIVPIAAGSLATTKRMGLWFRVIHLGIAPDTFTHPHRLAQSLASIVLHEVIHTRQTGLTWLSTVELDRLRSGDIEAVRDYLSDPHEIEAHAAEVAMGVLDFHDGDTLQAAACFAETRAPYQGQPWMALVEVYGYCFREVSQHVSDLFLAAIQREIRGC